ncbi:TadE/TadG family type IV pilus assembly protein [Methylobacterium durans]|uniref:TadE/TadG family type IV pilus assembly protein n=1 Tax=Methylobacterium durans TaxID=2202825 RepID=UPI002AFEE73F|nr:TadE/TadG family type IV pilus assembly protein [Methylobacterium durans]MEA1832241.1 TadE/TadG family type IV pilus assembly protein [Methylobacterium durans]
MADPWRRPERGLLAIPGRFRRAARGSLGVEMAVLMWPLVMLLVGITQFLMHAYTQVLLSNALFDSAARPETELTAGDAAGYKTKVCAKILLLTQAGCRARLVVEMTQLSSAATSATAVTGATFSPGATKDLLLLRAALPSVRYVPFLPILTAKASVVFRRA